ncbi:ABC transporter transmembrane region [Pyrenophora tritici-repentis]|uniref:ABC transporter transmembrane region n=1 Tax=Pyrenophora tritici-repentis TaxID=45151 RepID=A0A922N0Y3_9PLEO|nr:ABC transporter transmembrane region [Pyrenophora tritici-repentis]
MRTFITVATWVAEAEAHIPRAQERFWKRAVKLWTDIHALPETNPLRRNTSRMRKFRRQYRSPLFQVAEALKDIEMEQMETIRPGVLAPWEKRVQTVVEDAAQGLEANWAVRIAVSSSARNGVAGMGGAISIQKNERQSFSVTLGKREEQNPYSAELAAMAEALSRLPKLSIQGDLYQYIRKEFAKRKMLGYRPIPTEENIELDRFSEFENAGEDGLTEEEELVIKRQLDVRNGNIDYSTLLRQATRTEIFIMSVSFAMSIIEGASLPLMTIAYGSYTGSYASFSTNKMSSEQFEKHMNKITLYYIYLGIGIFICNYIGTFSLLYTAEKITERLRQRYMRALFRQNIGFFDFLGSGEITARISSDMVLIQNGLGQKVFLFASAVSRSIAALVIGLSQGWKLTLILLEPTLAMVSMVVFCSKRMSKNQTRAMEEYASASTFAEEVFSSARNFTAYGMQKRLQSKYKVYLDKASRWDYRSKLWLASMIAGMMGLLHLQYALAFWKGDQFIHSGQLSVSKVATITACVKIAGVSFVNSLPHFQAFVQAFTAASKVFNVIQRKSPIDPERYDGKIPGDIFGNIDFVKIKHVYPSRPDVIVLKEFNLSIKSGMIVALVGASGSGKSTVLGLLERFYLPVAGQILLDGTDISTLNLRWLRGQIAIVTQEPVLFNVSIYESIEHGLIKTRYEHASETVKKELVENAARLANAHNFIMELPEGYHTRVGECGSSLSGGQKQRIAIARAIVSNPKILLLDEATAALDAKSEKIVQEALNKASMDRTTIVIAHRLSTITNADMIVVMSDGQIVEQGNHNELIKHRGVYESLIRAQELRTHIESTNGPSEMLAGCEVSSKPKRVATNTSASSSTLPMERHIEKPLNMDDIDEDLIAKACKDANIYEFIISLPNGFNTVVGTKGILLSGGQRQRIAIARALLRNPKILLLDEATSALDSTSERLVQNALDAASHGRTTIAIAHRLSTIQHADAIYVFSEDVQLRTPTPPAALPEAPWVAQTPSNARELEAQSSLIRERVRQHKSSSPASIIMAIDQLKKGAEVMMLSAELMRDRISSLEKANSAASERRRRSKRRIQKHGVLTKGAGEDILAQNEADQQIAHEERQGGARSGLSQRAQRRCTRCKETGHNSRTCKTDTINIE